MNQVRWAQKSLGLVLLLGLTILPNLLVEAAPPNTQSGALGVQGTIPTSPPSRGPTITVPGNNATLTGEPVTVGGICPAGLLIKLFDNNVFVGSVICSSGGSYSLQIDLFSGQNDLVARDYDALDQTGPDSNTVSVTFNDAQFLQFGTHTSLSSVYAERGAAPGSELEWPIILSGGNGPYAISVDWGDGSPSDLFTESYRGSFTIKHTYKSAGVYNVIVKATDKNGGTAYLQLVGQATGAIQQNNKPSGGNNVLIERTVLWWPGLIMLPLIFFAFWLGRRYQTAYIKKMRY